VHTTVAYNTGEGLRIDSVPTTVVNSILWENTITQAAGPADITFSDVQGGFPGDGNLDLSPLFLNPNAGEPDFDLHLEAFSPVVDQGTDLYPDLPNNDYDADPRPQGLGYDMGMDEVTVTLDQPELAGRVETFTSTGFATTLSADIEVANNGTVASGQFAVAALLLGGETPELLSVQVVNDLAAGATTTFSTGTEAVESLTGRTILVRLDITQLVEESDETDNTVRIVVP
jgi:hypothetical protein